VAERLERHGYRVGVLVGDVDQKKRIRTLREFKEGGINILVATDVASRGLHIEAVSHVFNYDLPQDPEDYVHRIGRTARAGASGKAFSLACEHHVYSLEAIEEFIGRPVPHAFPEADLVKMPRPLPRTARVETAEPGHDAAARGDTAAAEAERLKRRSSPHRNGSVERVEHPAEAAPVAAAVEGEAGPEGHEPAADAGAAPKRKRRRRRRRRGGPDAAPADPAGEPD